MIIKIAIFLIVLILMFIVVNSLLSIRSKSHSNKAIEKIILKFPFNLFLKPHKQGWTIVTFKTNKPVCEFDSLKIPYKGAFHIKDENCSGMADPFLIKESNLYYLFFEYEYHKYLKKGADLAYAVSKNGIDWIYKQKILQEPFHQSFPYVFNIDENFYLLPESNQSNQVRLYKAEKFPNKWTLDHILFEGLPLVDTVFIEIKNVFYWLTTNLNTNELMLFYSNGIKGVWNVHPCSPISKSNNNNRNAGPIVSENNKIYRVAQDASKGYGSGVNLYQILEISKTKYLEKVIKEPLFIKNKGIFKDASHHLSIINTDGNEKLIAVDGANFAMNKIIIK